MMQLYKNDVGHVFCSTPPGYATYTSLRANVERSQSLKLVIVIGNVERSQSPSAYTLRTSVTENKQAIGENKLLS